MLSTTERVLSGMRPTGSLHLGHYHGVLKNWLVLQEKYECYFFIADWHALTTHYDAPGQIAQHTLDMAIAWLAVGVSPEKSHLFIQSQLPEHAELHLLLSMFTPLSWLTRIPSYKDQQEKLTDKDLSTYGFLGYPLLQTADVLIYNAHWVPVGEDQVAHIEMAREVARRFNFMYGREANFATKVAAAIEKLGKKNAIIYTEALRAYQEQGDKTALGQGQQLIINSAHLSLDEQECLQGHLEGSGKTILTSPESLLVSASKLPGLDGRKMSKSYGNTIALTEKPEHVEQKIKTMPTDPARVRRSDKGEPTRCPVWSLHKVYSDESTQAWVQTGCRSAGIGCVECKAPVVRAINAELAPIQERIAAYQARPKDVYEALHQGTQQARKTAQHTLAQVKEAMGLVYPEI